MRKYLFTSLFCLTPLFILAQDEFVVYSMKGEITTTQKDRQGRIQTSDIFSANSIIQLSPGAAITFICKKGGWFSITEPGNYSLNISYDSCHPGKDLILANYIKYMWAHSQKKSVDKGRLRKAYFINEVGAVTGPNTDIWVQRPLDTVNYSGAGNFPLAWKTTFKKVSRFDFLLYDSGNTVKPFYRTIIKEQQIPISGIISQLKQGKTYYWGIAIPGEEDELLRVFNYVSQKKYDSLLLSLKKLRPWFEAPAEEAYRLAFMLEDEHYFAEALEYYNKAILLDPANVLYKATLAAFKKDFDIDKN